VAFAFHEVSDHIDDESYFANHCPGAARSNLEPPTRGFSGAPEHDPAQPQKS
jgi:hypothetical protein